MMIRSFKRWFVRHIFRVSKTRTKTPNQDQIGNHFPCGILVKEVSSILRFVRSLLDIYRIIYAL